MVSDNQNFEMVSGDTLTIEITVTDQEGTPVNLTSHTINWVLTSGPESTTAIVSKSTTSGITITDASGGVFEVALAPLDTATLAGLYYFEACITAPTTAKYTVTTGWMTIEADVIP